MGVEETEGFATEGIRTGQVLRCRSEQVYIMQDSGIVFSEEHSGEFIFLIYLAERQMSGMRGFMAELLEPIEVNEGEYTLEYKETGTFVFIPLVLGIRVEVKEFDGFAMEAKETAAEQEAALKQKVGPQET